MKGRSFQLKDTGNVSILVALGLTALIGIAALAIDAGIIYIGRARLVNAVDAAVLAGVHELPQNPSKAVTAASLYADKNGIDNEEISFQVSPDHKSITGTAHRQVDLFFARIWGYNNREVKAQCQATVQPISGYQGIVPFGIKDQGYTFGESVTLKQGSCRESHAGWFGALRSGGQGADIYRDNIKYGCQERVSTGQILNVEPGNMSGPTSQGINHRINGCQHSPSCSINSFKEGCSRILIVPMGFHNGEPGANGRFTVTGFAAFLVTEYTGHGNDNTVEGAFIRYVVADNNGATGTTDFGLYSARLTQ